MSHAAPQDEGFSETRRCDVTPTGVETVATLRCRRRLVLGLNVATWVALCLAVARLCAAGGWTLLDIALLTTFMVAAPWSVLGFWNGLLGFWLLHLRRAPEWTAPFPRPEPAPLSVDTAVIMTLRNEDPGRALARLRASKTSLDATGHGEHFCWFVLSDTDDPGIAAAEAAAFADWRGAAGADGSRMQYRRRRENTGFKAGNLREFCERRGGSFEYMLLLDADSLMSGETIVDLVLLAQAHPRLGIAQTLAVGLPAASPFARLFQFGMRHGLRTYMTGAAWWAADCGSFWGHNALVRIAPYLEHCRLPVLPGEPPWGGAIMAHDQVEAVLMRRAGFEVRVFPQDAGSFEDAPPDLVAYTTRDLRWCQGNLQYRPLLGLPGLLPTSRFQLFWAAMMFYGMPAWSFLLVCVALRCVAGFGTAYPVGLAASVYLAVLSMGIMPKLAGYAGIGTSRVGLAHYGGAARFCAGCVLELVASFMIKTITEFRVTLFMLALAFGRGIVWGGQVRDGGGIRWSTAAAMFWPHTAFGAAIVTMLALASPALVVWSLPLTAGLVLAIPFAVASGDRRLGAWFVRTGLCGTPEEVTPPPVLRLLADPPRGAP